jgi:hypothetical protein
VSAEFTNWERRVRWKEQRALFGDIGGGHFALDTKAEGIAALLSEFVNTQK